MSLWRKQWMHLQVPKKFSSTFYFCCITTLVYYWLFLMVTMKEGEVPKLFLQVTIWLEMNISSLDSKASLFYLLRWICFHKPWMLILTLYLYEREAICIYISYRLGIFPSPLLIGITTSMLIAVVLLQEGLLFPVL